jgi:hypothetical protein
VITYRRKVVKSLHALGIGLLRSDVSGTGRPFAGCITSRISTVKNGVPKIFIFNDEDKLSRIRKKVEY